MARHSITQMQLARQLGISQSLLSHIFSARSLVDLTPEGAARIADAIEACAAGVVAA
jgi:transcriptional regulator with XRE-family HTH domain